MKNYISMAVVAALFILGFCNFFLFAMGLTSAVFIPIPDGAIRIEGQKYLILASAVASIPEMVVTTVNSFVFVAAGGFIKMNGKAWKIGAIALLLLLAIFNFKLIITGLTAEDYVSVPSNAIMEKNGRIFLHSNFYSMVPEFTVAMVNCMCGLFIFAFFARAMKKEAT